MTLEKSLFLILSFPMCKAGYIIFSIQLSRLNCPASSRLTAHVCSHSNIEAWKPEEMLSHPGVMRAQGRPSRGGGTWSGSEEVGRSRQTAQPAWTLRG